MGTCEFFYDFSSPFAYLGATQIQKVCEGHTLIWRPFLLGALFKSIGTPIVPLATFPAAKARLAIQDQYRWADHLGIPFVFPKKFPQNSVNALRVVLQAPEAVVPALSLDLFEEVWARDGDIEDPATLGAVAARHGLDAEAVLAGCQDPAVKAKLRANTEEAAARGICGAPSCIVGERVFWGQDRLEFVRRALEGWDPPYGLIPAVSE